MLIHINPTTLKKAFPTLPEKTISELCAIADSHSAIDDLALHFGTDIPDSETEKVMEELNQLLDGDGVQSLDHDGDQHPYVKLGNEHKTTIINHHDQLIISSTNDLLAWLNNLTYHKLKTATSLNQLAQVLNDIEEGKEFDLTNLPTFSKTSPQNTNEVYSYDDKSVLVYTHKWTLEIRCSRCGEAHFHCKHED